MIAKNYSKNSGWIQKMMAYSLHISNMTHHDGSKFMAKYEKKVKKSPKCGPHFLPLFCSNEELIMGVCGSVPTRFPGSHTE